MGTSSKSSSEKPGKILRIDEEEVRGHLDRVVRESVEETLNTLLDEEADRLCKARRYERTRQRRDTRASHYKRGLETKAGKVELKVLLNDNYTCASAAIRLVHHLASI